MPVEHKLQRCSEDDPNRCQSTGKSGQCPYLAIADSSYCQRHSGRGVASREKAKTNQYRLQVWQQRVGEFSESESVKSLRDEIGILRLIMEETLNKCKTTTDLMLYSNKLSDLALRIEKLVTSCNRLETRMGLLLDKAAALNLASQIVNIITEYIEDPDIIDSISSGIIDSLASLTGNTSEKDL